MTEQFRITAGLDLGAIEATVYGDTWVELKVSDDDGDHVQYIEVHDARALRVWLDLVIPPDSVDETAEHPDTVRLRWLANTVLFCDYGDNSHPDKLIGWRVFEFNAPLAYGPSINEAIDAARKQEKGQSRRRPSAQETSAPLTGGVPIGEYIAELEKDTDMKVQLDRVRAEKASGEPIYECCNESCLWRGLESETVHPKHEPSRFLCPECHEVVELV